MPCQIQSKAEVEEKQYKMKSCQLTESLIGESCNFIYFERPLETIIFPDIITNLTIILDEVNYTDMLVKRKHILFCVFA